MRILKQLCLLFACICLNATCVSAQSPLTADELLEAPELKGLLQSVLNGEIVTVALADREKSNQLNVAMVLLVPASLEKTTETLQHASASPEILAAQEIPTRTEPSKLAEAFRKVNYEPEEAPEVQKMLEAAPNGLLNLSAGEINMVRERAEPYKEGGGKEKGAARAMSVAMKDVLRRKSTAVCSETLDIGHSADVCAHNGTPVLFKSHPGFASGGHRMSSLPARHAGGLVESGLYRKGGCRHRTNHRKGFRTQGGRKENQADFRKPACSFSQAVKTLEGRGCRPTTNINGDERSSICRYFGTIFPAPWPVDLRFFE